MSSKNTLHINMFYLKSSELERGWTFYRSWTWVEKEWPKPPYLKVPLSYLYVFFYLTLSGLMTHEMNTRESTVNHRIDTINTTALRWVEKEELKFS